MKTDAIRPARVSGNFSMSEANVNPRPKKLSMLIGPLVLIAVRPSLQCPWAW
jgi:hypothetical protein